MSLWTHRRPSPITISHQKSNPWLTYHTCPLSFMASNHCRRSVDSRLKKNPDAQVKQRKKAEEASSVVECNTHQRKEYRNSHLLAGWYLPFKVVQRFPPERANLFFCLLFHKHSRVGGGRGGLHPRVPVSCLNYSFLIPSQINCGKYYSPRSDQWLHMRATVTCSVLKCHQDAAKKSPQIPVLWRLGGSI